jgi:hypothetical protein
MLRLRAAAESYRNAAAASTAGRAVVTKRRARGLTTEQFGRSSLRARRRRNSMQNTGTNLIARLGVLAAFIALVAFVALNGAAADKGMMSHTSKPFAGAKVNGGTVTHTKDGNRSVLTLSDDFQVPDTPDPHWQVVDSHGTVYLLERLDIKEGAMSMGAMTAQSQKGGKGVLINRSITLPAYVKDVAKVQIYCAWAEALLGEASFDQPVK